MPSPPKPDPAPFPTASRPIDERPLRWAMSDSGWIGDHVRDLAAQVGGLDVFEALDDLPLPDEPFDWSVVPPEHLELTRRVVELADTACDTWGDVELRTVCRRLWARVVASHPATLGRVRSPNRLAAAVVWLAMKGNGSFRARRWLSASLLWHHFGVGSCTDLGRTLLEAAGLRDIELERRLSTPSEQAVVLPDPQLLTRRFRTRLVERRVGAERAVERERATRRAMAPVALRDDGQIEVRMQPISPPQFCLKVAMEGPAPMLAVGFGSTPLEADQVIGLTVADARRLISLLDQGIRSAPSATAG